MESKIADLKEEDGMMTFTISNTKTKKSEMILGHSITKCICSSTWQSAETGVDQKV